MGQSNGCLQHNHNKAMFSRPLFNFLPNDKSKDWSKLKHNYAEDKTNISEKLRYMLGRLENIVGKGENTGSQHFLLFL